MGLNFLDFERPIVELEEKIQELKHVSVNLNLTDEIDRLRRRADELIENIFAKLTPWQVTLMARHPLRPHPSDYIHHLFTDFQELHGDRHCSAAPSIIGGFARFNGEPIMILGHEKGRKVNEKVKRNFGMAQPEAYRKALRLMRLAEKFHLPLFTFIDTPGAYPGIDAEERNQSEAIARNLQVMSELSIPIIVTVTGEGGSGGALAIGVGDRLMMLEYAVYSVISPEGCASILWKNTEKSSEAAQAMGVTATQLKALHLIDHIIPEPPGGAHRNSATLMKTMRSTLNDALIELNALPIQVLKEKRYERLMQIGHD